MEAEKADETGQRDCSDEVQAYRVLDANLNRAAEGMRVVEDYTRFILDDVHLTSQWKQLRHELAEIFATVPAHRLLAARDTARDVGSRVTAPDEYQRCGPAQVAAASQSRTEQALRCLEEYAKPLWPAVAPRVEQLRYRAYALAKATSSTHRSELLLQGLQLYVLIDGGPSLQACATQAEQLIEAGVRLFQLREKRLPDRLLIERARRLCQLMRPAGAQLIVNDRPDIARIVNAAGVHVGQDELTVKDARLVVGTECLIGVSTHTIEQARQAVLDGANYIGCGPTFPSSTKHFDHFPGLEFLQQVASEIRLPAFAIGGIDGARIEQIRAAGFSRVAVGSSITGADCPPAAAVALLGDLNPVDQQSHDTSRR